MQGTTKHGVYQRVWGALHGLVVLSLVGLALVGQLPVEGAWIIRPAVYGGRAGRRADQPVQPWGVTWRRTGRAGGAA